MKKIDLLLKAIDLYIAEYDRQRIILQERRNNSINFSKHGFDRGKMKKEIFGDLIGAEVSGIQFDDFIEDLVQWRKFKTFENLEQAKGIVNALEVFEIEIPDYMGKCYNEIEERTEFIKAITTKPFNWEGYAKAEFIRELQTELVEFSIDEESKKIRLRELFNNRVTRIKEYERFILDKFNHHIDLLFKEDAFIGTEFNLNLYFYEGEKKHGTVEVYGILQSLFREYFSMKNEVAFLHDLVQGRLDGPIETLLNEPEKRTAPTKNNQGDFSVLEWATIFYYVDETKLTISDRNKRKRIQFFMNAHDIDTSYDSFKQKYYSAKKRINDKNDYPIHKLEAILPFLQKNYNETVTKVENDIIILEEYLSDL